MSEKMKRFYRTLNHTESQMFLDWLSQKMHTTNRLCAVTEISGEVNKLVLTVHLSDWDLYVFEWLSQSLP